ncbi:MAG TPA: YceI family protein [Nitrospirota bacterium]|nr:YceI family protein [Nitrospirota bacterium]
MKKCAIDPDHSVATFAVRHMMIANVRGMFSSVHGTIQYDEDDITRSSVEAVIDVASLNSGVKKRDEHLRSHEILDAAKYPTMTFRSSRIERRDDNSLAVHGDLTIHGVTRRVTFHAEHFGPVKSPWGGEVSIGVICHGQIDREDFGVTWGSDPIPGGGLMTSRSVEITLDVEADLPENEDGAC